MIKVGKKWVGQNPTEQIKLERLRFHRRKAYRLAKGLSDGNKSLLEYKDEI